MSLVFHNRKQAGKILAYRLKRLPKSDLENVVVLALPRGGVPIAFEIAQTFHCPLEVLIVRKIGHPSQPEFGVGAVSEEGFRWFAGGMPVELTSQIAEAFEMELREVDRRVALYRQNRPLPTLDGKTVLLIDDGLATGVTAHVAINFVKHKGAKKVILAIPVCSMRTAKSLKSEVDQFICLNESSFFLSVGQFYRDFTQVKDEEVIKLLSKMQSIDSLSKQSNLSLDI
jgi:putative phosphoribosyl transferase